MYISDLNLVYILIFRADIKSVNVCMDCVLMMNSLVFTLLHREICQFKHRQ